MSAATGEVFSRREKEFARGEHDEQYYQYRANIRKRIIQKLDSIAEDLDVLLGNERLDLVNAPYDWTKITGPVEKFLANNDE